LTGCHFAAEVVPPDLAELVEVHGRWATADDAARGKAIGAATDEDLTDLHDAVRPWLNEIDRFCASHDGVAEAYEAPILGSLAEAAIEAQLELGRRHGRQAHPEPCPDCDGVGFHRQDHPTVAGGWIPALCRACGGTGHRRESRD
jgi:hypothetical protein